MGILAGIIGGIVCGAAFMFLFGFLSLVPHLGWLDYLALPAFYVVGLIAAIYIGLKYEQLVS